MTTSILDHAPKTGLVPRAPRASFLQRSMRSATLANLRGISQGHLDIIEDDQNWSFGAGSPRCTITVRNPGFWTAAALGGTCGAGAAYMRGDWDCDNLTALVRILCRNRAAMEQVDRTANRVAQPLRALLHRFNRNSIEGSARNIHAHYDLGDALFTRMLDDSMMYSSAIYPHPAASLSEAQQHKNELLCRALNLQASDHLVEIGTGWGGFAVQAASTYGCRVTTTTISDDQHRIAQQRVDALGLSDRVTVLKRDYRELKGSYNKLVSIEMIEAVGHEYYPTFFRHCDRLLTDDGMAVLQAITISDSEYDRARREVDFIKRFIFPGSCIPSVTALHSAAAKASQLRPINQQDYGPHYAKTLAEWRSRCHQHASELAADGYDQPFQRLWDFYLSYCEGGFVEGAISVQHLSYAKPGWRASSTHALGYA
ncbi:MAG: cyclopropane-fatty-acyl-phospholipid synthase [Planctomycetota bacterium]|jgi:cyclopropane-fatty-acyl-phospholipid synthase|nr:cyclopropane-fatty-acyl-phospholipid synthase [Planctomycetota bacterium]